MALAGIMLSLLLVQVLLLGSVVEAKNAPLVWLNDYPQAKCLDGSPAAYYLDVATNPANANKWVIYLAGGGECDTEAACQYQTNGALGSSKYFSAASDSAYWYALL
jgi:hypothetical protein